jgi:hypothetical protein
MPRESRRWWCSHCGIKPIPKFGTSTISIGVGSKIRAEPLHGGAFAIEIFAKVYLGGLWHRRQQIWRRGSSCGTQLKVRGAVITFSYLPDCLGFTSHVGINRRSFLS